MSEQDIEWWIEETRKWESKCSLLQKEIKLMKTQQKAREIIESIARLEWIMKMNGHAVAVRKYYGENFDTNQLVSLILTEIKRLKETAGD